MSRRGVFLSITVPGADEHHELRDAARRVWAELSEHVRSPLRADRVAFDAGEHEPQAIAWARPIYGDAGGEELEDRALVVPSTRLLTTASDAERRLTLLHELIHMSFAFGEHRERWQRMLARSKALMKAANEIPPGNDERANDEFRRSQHALMLLALPDEIVAEQRLKRDYPQWFEERAGYYVSMRQDRESEVAAPQPDDPLWPFRIFYELLCVSFVGPLTAGTPFEAELQRLEAHTAALLREAAPEDLTRLLLDLKPRLLDVRDDAPLDAAEAAYETLFQRVISVELRASPA